MGYKLQWLQELLDIMLKAIMNLKDFPSRSMDRRDQTLIDLVMTLDLGKIVLYTVSYNDFLQ